MDTFVKRRDYLVCVDSDGCAMDTMDIKHERCFGPLMVEEWGLEAWREPVLKRWNAINLYTMTRGINRFKGLAMALAEVNERYTPIAGIEAFCQWAENERELSNRSLEKAVEQSHETIFAKALNWSRAVNEAIERLPESAKKPFAHVAEGLKAAHAFADVAVVSSANRDAVLAEWEQYGLTGFVDVLLCQDAGSKAHCIGELLKQGYDPDRVLMVGDAPGDQKAAEQNGVLFYPILVRKEAESWKELAFAGLHAFFEGRYDTYGRAKREEFFDNLRGAEDG